ncbi:MAG: tagatose 1,6-diphosphate aldolase [Armatimonadota bacterium]|nr:tagatose 1,6-diphosphate aldolase [Armatimonadota bacterium]MDR7449691.1 tagatose 1,6-diphosphate aldolase [Armatimonadota bacterium]MDR7458393.1 tagatose 1,6-diphosphate aldolase [Armatimonadota bacterium]MDR7478804.1 tagatose 1,6-diphosphate aldolase [Armatimonadota bacterium]MDR7488827.1 tagatose 1,6-diphosphate aldolase [Armatimonadota bacterium]
MTPGAATVALSPGKLLNLVRLADRDGRFRMLAVDQRDSLRAALARATGRSPGQVSYEELARVKTLLTEILAPHATAVLVDPVYGFPHAVPLVPRDVGLLTALEETGYEPAGEGGRERRARLVEGWSVDQVKRSGANAAKLLLHYNPEASAATRAHQQGLAQAVGEACARADLPFLLEVVTYPLGAPAADTPEFARDRPRYTAAAAEEFSQERYRVDVLKLEFPADLRYCPPFHHGVFDGRERPAVYTLTEVRAACRAVSEAARPPWVLLSGGVGIDEFLVGLELAVEAGASGFLCGRAIWQPALARYPDLTAMEAWLRTAGTRNLLRAGAAAVGARPWFEVVGGPGARLQVREAGEGWHRKYGGTP